MTGLNSIRIRPYPLLWFVILATVGMAVTSVPTQFLYGAVRAIAVGALFATLAIAALTTFRLRPSNQLRALILFWILSAGIVGAWQNGTVDTVNWDYLLVSVLGVLAVMARTTYGSNWNEERWILIYVSGVLVVTHMLGGVSWDLPPKYILSHAAGYYSPSLGFVFSIGAVLAFTFACRSNFTGFVFYSLLSLIFLAHVFFSGGRGELIIAVFVILLIALTSRPLITMLFILGSVVASLALARTGVQLPWGLDQSLAFQRMILLFQGHLSDRDTLIMAALATLNDPVCFFFGCGFNYFQHHNDLPQALYPHNFTLEMAITAGVPFTLFFLFCIARGMYVVFVRSGLKVDDGLLSVGVFVILHAHKSFSITSAFLAFALSFYFAGLAMKRPHRRRLAEPGSPIVYSAS